MNGMFSFNNSYARTVFGASTRVIYSLIIGSEPVPLVIISITNPNDEDIIFDCNLSAPLAEIYWSTVPTLIKLLILVLFSITIGIELVPF